MVCFAMTQSIIPYKIIAWGGLRTEARNKLLIAQKWVVKIILKKPKSSRSENQFKELELFSIQQLFYRNGLNYIYKLNLIDIKPKIYKTRKENNLFIQTFKTLISSKHFDKVELDPL